MQDLDISGNAFTGTVPTALMWSPSVANRSLGASGNHLTGVSLEGPSGGAPFPLRSLDLSYNVMSGELPTIFCGGSPVAYLVLSFQSLTGTIPECLASVPFIYLDLSNNFFIGSVPSAFGHMASVEFLSLAHNNLDGPLPLQLFSDLHAATTVDVSQNFHNGTVPLVGAAAQLTLFDVTSNCGLLWPTVYDCQSAGCSPPYCCVIECSSPSLVCNLLPQLPTTLCAYARPPAPLGVHASSIGSDGSLMVRWSAPPLVHARFCTLTHYAVQVALPNGSVVFNATVAATEYEANATGAPPGNIVIVNATAVNCVGKGAESYPTSVLVIARPGAPSGVRASGLDTGASLQWVVPLFSGVNIDSYRVEATQVGYNTPKLYSVAASGGCTLSGLVHNVYYVFRVRAECSDPDPSRCPGPWSAPADPVLTYINVPTSLIDQLVAKQDVVAGACGAALLYCALLLANRKWKGRDFTALFRLAAVAFHIWTSAVVGVKLMRTDGVPVQQIVYFAALAAVAAWSTARAAAFVRRSLLVPTPPAPHTLTFDAWCTKYRSLVSALLFVSCFELSALDVLRSRAFGPVDGMLSAPIDHKLWSEMLFHATATSLLRAVSTLVILVVTYPTQQYFLLSVLAGLTSSIGTLGYSIVTLLVDAAVRANGRHRAKQSTSDARVPLLGASSEVGMEMLSDPAHAAAPPTLLRARQRGGGRGPSDDDDGIAALCARVGAFDGGLASDLRAAIAEASAAHEAAAAVAREAAATASREAAATASRDAAATASREAATAARAAAAARDAAAAAASDLRAATDRVRELEAAALAMRSAPQDVAVQ